MERRENEEDLRKYKSFVEENGLIQRFEEFVSSKKNETNLEEKGGKKEIETQEKEGNEEHFKRMVNKIFLFSGLFSFQKQRKALILKNSLSFPLKIKQKEKQ